MVREVPSVRQKVKGPCGYYALFNLLCMSENDEKMKSADCDYSFMVDRERFEDLFSEPFVLLRVLRGENSVDVVTENVVGVCGGVWYSGGGEEQSAFGRNGNAQYHTVCCVGADRRIH